jgi:uncharacterized membrane protein
MDSKRRSIIKAITWRILALLITILVSFAILGSWSVSIAIGILSNFLKTLLYYIHERLWEKTSWGRV